MSLETLKQCVTKDLKERWGSKQLFAHVLADMMRVPREVARRKLHLLLSPKGGLSGWWEPIAKITDTRLSDHLSPAEREYVLLNAKPIGVPSHCDVPPERGGSGARIISHGGAISIGHPDASHSPIIIKSASELGAFIYALRCAGIDLE